MNIERFWALFDRLRNLKHFEFNHGPYLTRSSCGTTACLAGHAAILSGLTDGELEFVKATSFSPDDNEWCITHPDTGQFGPDAFAAWLGITRSAAETIVLPWRSPFRANSGQEAAHLLLHVCKDFLPDDDATTASAVLLKEHPSAVLAGLYAE